MSDVTLQLILIFAFLILALLVLPAVSFIQLVRVILEASSKVVEKTLQHQIALLRSLGVTGLNGSSVPPPITSTTPVEPITETPESTPMEK